MLGAVLLTCLSWQIKHMEMEVRGEQNEGTKRAMHEKVTQYKKTLASLRRDHEETKREEEKAALFEVSTRPRSWQVGCGSILAHNCFCRTQLSSSAIGSCRLKTGLGEAAIEFDMHSR